MIKVFPNMDTTSNTYLIKEDEKIYIVDPGSLNLDNLINYLKENEIKIEAIILTHGHFDHIMGLPVILNYQIAPIYLHEKDYDLLFNPSLSLLSWAGMKQELLDEYLSKTKVYTLKEDDIIANFKVIHTPGHTAGSICLLNEKEKIMLSGDTIFKGTYGRTDLPTGNSRELRDSISKILKLDKDIKVYPGHSDATTIEDEYYNYMSYY